MMIKKSKRICITYRSIADIVGGSAVNSYTGGGSFGIIVSITGICF